MTGTGTEDNPYIVDNIADFRTACKMSRVYVELSADIDCNDDAEISQGWESLSVNAYKIDGKGHTIRNLYTTSDNSQSAIVFMNYSMNAGMNNINFENIIYNNVSNGSCLFYCGGVGSFYNCNFSGIINTCSAYAFNNYGISAEKCTFNFKVFSNNTANFSFCSLYMESCEVKINAEIIDSSSYLIAKSAVNSYVLGSIKSQKNLTSAKIHNYASGSYSALNIKNAGSIKFADTIKLTCFYNRDLLEGTEITAQDNLYSLSTADCKNINELQKIGFLVV